MAKLQLKKASTNVTLTIFIQNSSSTTGAGLTGLVYNSAGLTCYYVRPGSTAAALTLATQTVAGAHSDGGFVEIDSANMPGWYRLDISDAIVATGVDSVGIHLKGATNMAPLPLEIQLTDFDLNSANNNQTGDSYAIVNNGTYGNAQLVRSTTPANTLTIDASNQAKSNITAISDDTVAADNLELQYDTTGLSGSTFPATQAQLTNIVAVGAATNVPAESYTLTTGTQSANTYTSTAALDAIRHEHTDTAGAMELYYQFDIGSEGAPVSATLVGYMTGGNDSVGVYAYNWGGASWDQIGTLQGGAAADSTSTYALYAATHVGTGANQGKVRIRFYAASGLTTATLAVDQLYVSYAVVRQTVGYANGSFWINTVSGTAGTEAYFNGTADNPVDSLADAQTISSTVPLTTYTVSNNSSITLAASFESSIMLGSGYTLAFGGQSISGSRISGANVSGTATGANPIFLTNCIVNAVTLPLATMSGCNIETGITFGSAGEYHLHNSHCGNANGIYVDYGVALGDNQLLVHGWQGEIELRNMGQLGTDVARLAGDGTLTIAASCTGGTVYYQGDWKFTDNTGGAVALVKSDYNVSIASILEDTGTTIPATLGTPAADISADIAAVKVDTAATLIDTAEIGVAGAGLTDLGGMSTAMKAEILTEAVKVLTTQMTESYAADGVSPTMTQALMLIQQVLTDFTISGTTKTAKKIDGATTAATFTLNDGTNPTGITRTT